MNRFKRGDCDALGIARYKLPEGRLTHRNNEVREAQKYLVKFGFLNPNDVDGNIGPGALQAIDRYEGQNNADFYAQCFGEASKTPDVKDAAVQIPNVTHTCQAWYPGLMLGPNDPCRKSGCLSCCCEITWALRDEREVDVRAFVDGMKERGGYNASAQIKWGVLEDWAGMKHEDRIDIESAQNHIESGTPCMVDIGGHWVLAIGYDEGGFHSHDVGYRLGNCYENPGQTEGKPTTYVEYGKVKRIDVLI